MQMQQQAAARLEYPLHMSQTGLAVLTTLDHSQRAEHADHIVRHVGSNAIKLHQVALNRIHIKPR